MTQPQAHGIRYYDLQYSLPYWECWCGRTFSTTAMLRTHCAQEELVRQTPVRQTPVPVPRPSPFACPKQDRHPGVIALHYDPLYGGFACLVQGCDGRIPDETLCETDSWVRKPRHA